MQTKGVLRIALLALMVLLIQGTWALAGTTGNITGTVRDQNGNAIASARVTVVSPSQTQTLTTGASGFYSALNRENLEIYDRVGGGDAFVSGFTYALLTGKDPQWAVNCGAAHGALAMSTPGDTSMATLSEVLQLMKGDSASIQR